MAKSYQEQIEETLPQVDEEMDDSYEEESEEPEVEGEEETEESSDEPTYKKGQVEGIVKTRVATLNKRIDKLGSYKTAVDRICELTGLDFDTLTSKLGGMTEIEQAKLLGLTPEQVREKRMASAQIAKERGTNQTLTRQLEEQKLMLDPKFKDYDLYKEEIDDILEDNPKLSLKQAYTLAKGENAISAASRDAEQRAIAREVNSKSKSLVKGSSVGTKPGLKISADVVAAAKAVGMDPAEYAKYQGIDNIDAYRNSKKK